MKAKTRILSLLLAVTLLVGLIPATAVSAAADSDEIWAGSGQNIVNGDHVSSGQNTVNAAAEVDTTVDYCKILGISKATAEKFGETIRASLRAYDFDIDLSSFKISAPDYSSSKVNAFRAMMEHEVFYQFDTFMFKQTTYNWWRNSSGVVTRILFNKSDALYTHTEYQSKLASVTMVAEHLMEGVKGNKKLSDMQKALLLHDRLAAWAQYDYDNQQANTCPPESYSVVGILWNKVGVCQGYSEVYGYMMDQCGIPNRYAQSHDLNHIWNIVTIGGAEYYVDVTWDDPANYDRYGQVLHDNFLVSLSKLRQNHAAYDYSTIKQNSTYDNYFWTQSRSEFQLIGNDIYYLDNVVDYSPRYSEIRLWNGIDDPIVQTVYDENLTKWTVANGQYYTTTNFSTLDSWNGKLYVSTAKATFSFDPATSTLEWDYVPALSEGDTRCMYGFTIHDGRYFLNVYADPPATQAIHKAGQYYHQPKDIVGVELVKKPTQYVYQVGDHYDFRGLTLKVKYADGTTDTIKNMVTSWNGYNSAVVGKVNFTVSWYGYSDTFDFQIVKGLSTPKVKAVNATKGVKVSWNKIGYAKEYIVYRSYKSGGKWSSWSKMNQTTSTSWTDTSAKDGKVYRYAVYAYHVNLRSSLGKSSDIARLKAPTVTLSNAKSGTYLSWKKVSGATSYAVYRCYRKSGKWTEYKKIGTTTKTTYTDKKAAGNTYYRYVVKAVKSGGYTSTGSTVKSIRRLTAVTPTVKKSGSTIKVSWKKVSGAKHYVVYRRLKGASKWTKLYSTKTRAYTDKTAKKGKYYEYSVRAVEGSSYSAYSASKKIKR